MNKVYPGNEANQPMSLCSYTVATTKSIIIRIDDSHHPY